MSCRKRPLGRVRIVFDPLCTLSAQIGGFLLASSLYQLKV